MVTQPATSHGPAFSDNRWMASKVKKSVARTGLYHARKRAGLTQTELAKKLSTTKNTIIRLESGKPAPEGIKLTRDWAERASRVLHIPADEILFWDQRHGDDPPHIESDAVMTEAPAAIAAGRGQGIPELEMRAGLGGGGLTAREVRRDGQHADPVKTEAWQLPSGYLREAGLHTSYVFVLENHGDSMFPTIASGDRTLVNSRHRHPTPDGIYALRDAFGAIISKRLQLTRTTPPRLKIISDNPSHPIEEVGLDEVEIVGKVEFVFRRL